MGRLWIAHDSMVRNVQTAQSLHLVDGTIGSQHHGAITIRMSLDNIQRRCSNRPGGTKNSDTTYHSVTHQ
jgi:hypothetical protein